MTTRRRFIALAGAAGLAGGWSGSARGQGTVAGWPQRSVRVISPTATGGPGQNFRFYADNLKDTFGQSFVLENIPGGSGSVGTMTVARSAPDGHTLVIASNSFIVLAPLVIGVLAGGFRADIRDQATQMTRLLLPAAIAVLGAAQPGSTAANATLTAVPGIKVGHHTLTERPTGCTAILVDGDAVGGVSQRGGAPGTRAAAGP